MNQNSKPRLSFTAFMDWVDGWRAKHGLRPLTDDEYDELYERHLATKTHTLDLIDHVDRIEAIMAEAGPSRRMTPEEREATHAQLRRLPPERQRVILEMVRIIVERKRLDRRIEDGSATQN